jgi:hypothetical protein
LNFMGSESAFLGIGGPEVVRTCERMNERTKHF